MLCPFHIRPEWLFAVACSVALAGCSPEKGEKSSSEQVVVYSSVDDSYCRPLCERFTQATQIEVKLVPDSEETKSTGLLNRLIAEKERPQADVFWSGDPVRAAILTSKKIGAPYQSPQAAGLPFEFAQPSFGFTMFSTRMRVIIFNRNLLAGKSPPASVFDLINPRFRGAGCLANPLFGTTSMHAAALFQVLGEQAAKDYFRKLIENDVAMLSSNGEVRRRVAAGDFEIGLTDSDDANLALKDGAPIGYVLPDQQGIGTLLVPNAVVLIDRSPNPVNARKFIDFILSPDSERWLAESDAAQFPLHPGLSPPKFFGRSLADIKLMKVDYQSMATQLEVLSAGFLEQWVQQQNNLPARVGRRQ
jgi:iron(III) transport system substrate-binding protein